MDNVKILEVKQSIFASNDEQAAQLRQRLKEKKIFLLNLMSAPGSGKTTTLRSTIAALKDELRIGVMEADIDSDVDAKAIAAAGAKAPRTLRPLPLLRFRCFRHWRRSPLQHPVLSALLA